MLANVLELNSKGLYQSSRKEKESCCLVFPFSTKREIRHVHLEVVQRRPRNVQKSVMHVQSCCFANINLLHFCRSRCRRRRRCLSSLMAKPGTWDQDGWILANFFSAFLWIEKRSSSIKLQNWKRPIVDLTSMVEKENFLLRVGLTWEIPSGHDGPIEPIGTKNLLHRARSRIRLRIESLRITEMANVRFKLGISQNRKWAGKKNSSKQFLWIKNCVKLLIYVLK